MKLIRCLIFILLLSGCGPTLLSVGAIDVTTGDLAIQGVKKKILDDEKKKDTTDSKSKTSD